MKLDLAPRLRRPGRWSCSALVMLFLLAGWAGLAPAEEVGPVVVRVEEDWELVVGEPDAQLVAPQVTCAISPVGHLGSHHAAFELNHQSQPSFAGGGIQLQLWNGEQPLSSQKFPHQGVLNMPGEKITWTQSMSLVGSLLTFEVTSGSSTTWGSFGGQGYLLASVQTSLTSLNGYDPQVSVDNSGVGYASNRVNSLVLKRVRLYTLDGGVVEDSTPRTVYPQP